MQELFQIFIQSGNDIRKSALILSGPEGAKLHVARRRVESKLNKVVISKTKILRLRRWKVINFLAEFYYCYGRVYLKQPSYREGLIAWDFSKCAKKFALNHITINDNGGFNRHRHVGEEGETKGEAGSEQKLRRISRSAFEAFLRYSFVARTGAWQVALWSLRRSREKERDGVTRGKGTKSREMSANGTNEGGEFAPLGFPSGARKRGGNSRRVSTRNRRENRSARLERRERTRGWLEDFEKRKRGKNVTTRGTRQIK